MNCRHVVSVRKLIVALTIVGIITPSQALLAADPQPAAAPQTSFKLKTVDVELQSNGTLQGYYVDGEQGAGKSGVTLTLHQNAAEPIATTETGDNGVFQFTGLKAGTYQMVANNEHVIAYRAWTPGTAPPKTARQAVFAAQDSTRAAAWFLSLPTEARLAIIAAIIAGIAIPLAIAADDDDKKQANSEDGMQEG
ncbi:MAG: hypothetical protein JNG89_13435 [Planctomycetaceae bacterium]|nr:hypothetical protein [Planctomycetaceae bacterium]